MLPPPSSQQQRHGSDRGGIGQVDGGGLTLHVSTDHSTSQLHDSGKDGSCKTAHHSGKELHGSSGVALDGRDVCNDEPVTALTKGSVSEAGSDEPWLSHAARSALHMARPLLHCHSVNFVPDWEGRGVIVRLALGRAAAGSPALVAHQMYWQPGDEVALPPLGFSALGWMVGSGRSAVEAEANVAALLADVHMELRKPG
jgi:hypothetical protein